MDMAKLPYEEVMRLTDIAFKKFRDEFPLPSNRGEWDYYLEIQRQYINKFIEENA